MAEGKSFIQLFPSVMGSCFPPTGVKTRKLGFDSDCRGFFGCSNFLGISAMPDLPPDLEGKKPFEIPFLLCYNKRTACGVSA